MKVIKLPEGTVQWPIGTTTQWVGRNGCFDSCGVYYYEYDDKIALHPVGMRGKIGNCMIEVPKAAIPDLIAALCKALRISPDRETATPAKAYSEQVTLPSVARGQGESNGILRMDADFMKDIERR